MSERKLPFDLSQQSHEINDGFLSKLMKQKMEIVDKLSNRKYALLGEKNTENNSTPHDCLEHKKPSPRKIQEERPNDCVICMEPISQERGVLDCNHDYCVPCIQNWTTQTNKCPVCKIESKILRVFVGNHFLRSEFLERRELQIEHEPDELDIIVMNADPFCYKCDAAGNENLMLICNKCDKKCCHIFCLDPPLEFIPDDDWFCDFCVQKFNIRTTNPTAGIFNERDPPRSRRRRRRRPIIDTMVEHDESLEGFIVEDKRVSGNTDFVPRGISVSSYDSILDGIESVQVQKKSLRKNTRRKKKGKKPLKSSSSSNLEMVPARPDKKRKRRKRRKKNIYGTSMKIFDQ